MVVARKSFVAVAAVCFKAMIVLLVHSSQMWLLLDCVEEFCGCGCCMF